MSKMRNDPAREAMKWACAGAFTGAMAGLYVWRLASDSTPMYRTVFGWAVVGFGTTFVYVMFRTEYYERKLGRDNP